MAVDAGAGDHEIALAYRPAIFRASLATAGVAALAWTAVLAAATRAQRIKPMLGNRS